MFIDLAVWVGGAGEGHGSGAVPVAQGDEQAAETTGTPSIFACILPLIPLPLLLLPFLFPFYHYHRQTK